MLTLLSHRYLQEVGVLKRTLDELGEDIIFLAIQPTDEKTKALREKFLATFFAEAIEPGVSPMDFKEGAQRA